MADTKISDETAAGTLTGAELIPGVQGGANVKMTSANVASIVVSRARVPFAEQGSAPSSVANESQLFALEVGGRTELQTRASDGEITMLTRVRVRTGITSAFTFGDGDEIIYLSTASGAVIGTLPNPANHAGRQFLVWKTNTGTNKWSIARYASESINAVAASYDAPGSATAYVGCWHISCDGTNWFVSGGAIS